MAGLQLSGLASGFDWKSLVDSLMDLERVPITQLESNQLLNSRKLNSLATLGTHLTALRTATTALNDTALFAGRAATSTPVGSSTTINASVTAGAVPGSHSFAVTQLATKSTFKGATDIGSPIATTSDVSGVTLASMGTSATITAGDFTINGARVTVATTDSLQDVFDQIATATGGDVTASYDETTDRINLSSASEIILGSSNDTSNFLVATRLGNNGTGAVTSSSQLGTASTSAALASARLATAITAVDGNGDGAFTINGVSIDYNVNDDSISTIISRINAAGAGVTASFDQLNDRMVFTNSTTGDVGISVSEGAGGFLAAVGLTSGAGATLTRGLNAEYSVDGGATLTSFSNTLSADTHGITGLSVTAVTTGSAQIEVAADTESMRTKIDAFIEKYNTLQTYLDTQTSISASNGKVSAATLASNREVQNWGQALRSKAFAAVSGLTGTLTRLESLGIDFMSDSGAMYVKDSAKLDAALTDKPDEVAAFFQTGSTGFVARYESLFDSYIGPDGDKGLLESQTTNLKNSNDSIDQQIADIERRLVQRRAILESGFIAMESAQSKLQNMQTQIENNFFKDTSSS